MDEDYIPSAYEIRENEVIRIAIGYIIRDGKQFAVRDDSGNLLYHGCYAGCICYIRENIIPRTI